MALCLKLHDVLHILGRVFEVRRGNEGWILSINTYDPPWYWVRRLEALVGMEIFWFDWQFFGNPLSGFTEKWIGTNVCWVVAQLGLFIYYDL